MIEPAPYQEYLNRQERRSELLDARRIRELAALLDCDFDALAPGGRLPTLGHWMYFNPWARESELGPDGHPRRGGFMPPVPLPRRMFAGGRLTFHQPLFVGETAERVDTIVSVREKTGASGALVFVTVRHEVFGTRGLAIDEERDIVYRGDASTPSPSSSAPSAEPTLQQDDEFVRRVQPDPPMLFRFSALTSNTHRIHYDRTYAMEIEHYPGLVVHGPLQAALLSDLIRERWPSRTVAQFRFESRRPLFDTSPFECVAYLADSPIKLLTRDQSGQPCMHASASLA